MLPLKQSTRLIRPAWWRVTGTVQAFCFSSEPLSWRPGSAVLAELKRRKVYAVAALYAAPGDSSAGTITGQGPLPSIAVVDMSPDEYQEYFCAGTGELV